MRHIRTAAILALMTLGGCLISLAPPASAQTGYPPGACTPTSGSQDFGTVKIGDHFILQLSPICVFTAGAPVTVTVNGVNIPGKNASANGSVPVDITVVSATQLSVDDPVVTPAKCGVNTVVATGPSAVAKAQVTQTGTFTLVCPAVAKPAESLARTGLSIAKYVIPAVALLVAGWMLVVASRRRAQTR